MPRALAGWLVGPAMLLAAACAGVLVTGGFERGIGVVFAVVVASAVSASLAWVLVSVFWPATPDRTCPDCGRQELRRMDRSSMRGVVCARCGAADPDRSAFLFAEEDGDPIEPIVARERTRCRERTR